jgi:hypothetical protein
LRGGWRIDDGGVKVMDGRMDGLMESVEFREVEEW